ncbi:hypothetical protein DL98DRAFT_599302 [Cadophora sp. DSE1049]|nr:hypothetical protein DL98DRAFT_599302 [Cadophora sp. DSE1049]
MASKCTLLLATFLLCFIVIVSGDTQGRGFHTDIKAIRDDRSKPRGFERKVRESPVPTIIDWSTMPSCAKSHCTPSMTPTIDCPYISGPCPSDVANSSCQTYSKDCYCKQTSPLACAWGCSWFNWLLAEDWFARPDVCASTPNITFDALPSCARDCLWQSSFDYGCITHTKNCFCKYGSLYGCDKKCRAAADGGPSGKVARWFTEQCSVDMETANGLLGGSSYLESKDPPWKKLQGHRLKWYEVMAITVAGATSCALLVVWGFLKAQKRAKETERMGWRRSKVLGLSIVEGKVQKARASGGVYQIDEKDTTNGKGKQTQVDEVPKSLKDKFRKFDEELRSKIEKLVKENKDEEEAEVSARTKVD